MSKRFLLVAFLAVLFVIPAIAADVQKAGMIGGPVFSVNQENQNDRQGELDEIIWEEDFENGADDWEFIDANTQGTIYWQTSDLESLDGDNWRCFDPDLGNNGGYDNHWLQWIITPTLDLSDAILADLSFDFRLQAEDPAGAEAPFDGWDAANVWASDDGGDTWDVIEPMDGPEYNVSSAYSFGQEWMMGPGIPGWGGLGFDDWSEVVFDLSEYAGSDQVMIRFAFCSDPAACTADDPANADWTGFQIDNITLLGAGGEVYFSDDADGNNVGGEFTFAAGLDIDVEQTWDIYTVPDAHSPTHVLGIEDIPLAFVHYMQYTQFIDLTDLEDGTSQLDCYLRGAWDHPDPFPNNAHWTVKIRPEGENTWYYATNPYGEVPGTNYVFTDAPPEWSRYSETYGNPWDVTDYHGLNIEIRVEFEAPINDFNPGDRYIQFDDFFVENTSYEHDVATMNPVIPYPAMVGRVNPAFVTFFNNGTNTDNFITIWYINGRPNTFQPPQITLGPGESVDRWLDNNYDDEFDGWVPEDDGAVEIYARAVLQNDENTENNSSSFITVDVWPEDVFEFGYTDRNPTHFYGDFVEGDGPVVHFTPQDDIEDFGAFDLDAVRVMWNGDLPDDVDFTLHVYDGGDEPGEELYSGVQTAIPAETFPNMQYIDLSDVQGIDELGDFWVWCELTDPAAFPHIVRSSVYRFGEGHMFQYEDGALVESEYDWFVTALGAEVQGVEPPEGHFNPVEPTGQPYAIIIAEAMLNDEMLAENDEVGIFDGDLCVGAAVVNGEWPLPSTAWEGDPAQQLPGFEAGNPIGYMVWSVADQMEYNAVAEYLMGNGTFGFGPFAQINLTAISSVTLTLPLAANYFELISTNVVPPDLAAPVVFGDVNDLVIVYQDDGHIYIPPAINTIGDITMTEGYQVFCSSASEVTFEGMLMDPATVYDIYAGRWNWFGYPFVDAMPIQDALAPIMDDIVIVMTDEGDIFIPPAINTIGDMEQGVGYYIFTDADVNLVFAQPVMRTANTVVPEMPEVEGAPAATGLPYAVLVSLTDELRSSGASTIELYDGQMLVGKSVVLDNETTPVIAWGGNAEYDVAGFVSGHNIQAVVRDASGNLLGSVNEGIFGEGAYASVTIDANNLPSEFAVETAYPNPFNPSVTVPFALPRAGEVSFTVYNVMGQQIATSTMNYNAGHHRFVFDAASGNLVSGVYFLQVQFNGQVNTQKVMLLK